MLPATPPNACTQFPSAWAKHPQRGPIQLPCLRTLPVSCLQRFCKPAPLDPFWGVLWMLQGQAYVMPPSWVAATATVKAWSTQGWCSSNEVEVTLSPEATDAAGAAGQVAAGGAGAGNLAGLGARGDHWLCCCTVLAAVPAGLQPLPSHCPHHHRLHHCWAPYHNTSWRAHGHVVEAVCLPSCCHARLCMACNLRHELQKQIIRVSFAEHFVYVPALQPGKFEADVSMIFMLCIHILHSYPAGGASQSRYIWQYVARDGSHVTGVIILAYSPPFVHSSSEDTAAWDCASASMAY